MQGAYAEFITVLQTHVLRKPTHLSWTEAAGIPENFLTGMVKPGQSRGLSPLMRFCGQRSRR